MQTKIQLAPVPKIRDGLHQ